MPDPTVPRYADGQEIRVGDLARFAGMDVNVRRITVIGLIVREVGAGPETETWTPTRYVRLLSRAPDAPEEE